MKKLIRLFSLLLIIGLVTAALPMPVASAANLTVCASGGCDYTTISAAVAAASAGDTITVNAGLYTEHVIIDKSLTLIGTPDAIIDGGNTGVVVLIKASNVTFQGFTVQQSGIDPNTDAGIALLYANNCALSNNTVVNNTNGIAVMSSSNNTFTNNQVADNFVYGVVLEAYPLTPTVYSTGNTISGSTITRNGRDGIYVGEANNNNQILNNTISDTFGVNDPVHGWEANGIYFWKSSGNTVTGNTITGNINLPNAVGYGIEMRASQNNIIIGNTISGNYAGMVVRNNALLPITGNNISTNRIFDNTMVNLYADPNFIFSIENNWWGTTVESEIVAKLASWISGDKPDPWLVPGTTVNLDYNPWCANLECTAQVIEVGSAAELQSALASAPSGSTIRVNPGTYSQSGAFTINTDGLTIILEDDVVIYNELAACFLVNADYTYILGASKAGAKCRPGWSGSLLSGAHPGIHAPVAITNLVIDGLEIDGTGLHTGAGIYLTSGGTDIQILNNYIHDLSFNGVKSPAVSNHGVITGVADVQGNLFLRTAGIEENNAVNAAYNSWGAYAVTNAMVDVSDFGAVTFDPWTHVELFLTASSTPAVDHVLVGNEITYIVSADLVNITGAEFTLKYDPAKLEFVSATPTALFDPIPINGTGGIRPLVTPGSGEIKYAGWKLVPVSGLNQELFRVTFKALVAGTSTVFVDPATDVFGMSPDSGPSNNVYAAALDSATVTALDVLSLTALDLLESVDQTTWTDVPGSLEAGFIMLVDPLNPYEYLDAENIVVNRPLAEGLYPFYLDETAVPAGFYATWATKGVIATAPAGSWQAVMWGIINGEAPMFYLKVVNTVEGPEYDLIDGLQYLYGAVEETLRINGDYLPGTYHFNGTVTDEYGLTDSVPVAITFIDPLELTALDLLESVDQTTWTTVAGSLTDGFTMGLDPLVEYEYLDAANLVVNHPLDEGLHPFYLDVTALPAGFYDYWAVKGVTASAVAGTWQAAMWSIISGESPMFYLKVDGTSYDLVDGFQYLVGGVEEPLRINGDYLLGTYHFTGTVTDTYGLTDTVSVSITFVNLYNVTGSITVDSSLVIDGFFNAYYTGVPVVLTKQDAPVGYVYNGITSNPEGQNLSITNVMPGNYRITTNQPRVLNVTAGQNKFVNITGDRDLAPLMLIRGNAFWRDPETFVPDTIINIQDAGLVGYFFNATGDLDADVNFSGKVDVFDLAIVGGNFDLRSAVVYGGTNWVP